MDFTTPDYYFYELGTPSVTKASAPVAWQTWGIGMLIVFVSVFSPYAAILVLPCLSKSTYERFMTFLVALGAGTIAGSTLFILIPEAFKAGHLNESANLDKEAIIIAAVFAFFAVDRILAYILYFRKLRSNRHKVHQTTLDVVAAGGGAAEQKGATTVKRPIQKAESLHISRLALPTDENGDLEYKRTSSDGELRFKNETEQLKKELHVAILSNAIARNVSCKRKAAVVYSFSSEDSQDGALKGSNRTIGSKKWQNSTSEPSPITQNGSAPPVSLEFPASEKPNKKDDEQVSVCVDVVEETMIDTSQLEIGTIAYMIIFGSSANNFVDGMSNGAAFAESFSKGLSIGIAVIAQDFPRELGTLAILIKSGLGIKRTLLVSLFPNALSFVGFAVGAICGNANEEVIKYMFAVSAGMYLYIFLGTLVPEIRDSVNEQIKVDLRESLISTVLQSLGIVIGVVFMFVMVAYASDIQV